MQSFQYDKCNKYMRTHIIVDFFCLHIRTYVLYI